MKGNNIISRDRFGRISEYIAILYLLGKFYSITKLRFKYYTGEIDIIAKKGNTIVFIEVKSRKNLDHHYDIISKKQISRIKKTASFYLQKNIGYNNKYDIRFDLIVISNFYCIEHIKNVWS